MALSLETRAERDRAVVAISGDLEVGTTPQLRAYLAEVGQRDVIVDLTGLRFLDSTGLGVLVSALKRARARRCSLQLVCPGGPIREVLAMTGLTRVFEIHGALDAVPHSPRRAPCGRVDDVLAPYSPSRVPTGNEMCVNCGAIGPIVLAWRAVWARGSFQSILTPSCGVACAGIRHLQSRPSPEGHVKEDE